MKNFHFIILIPVLVFSAYAYEPAFVVDEPFYQEIHIPYFLPGDAANDVRKISVDMSGQVWAATKDGIYSLEKDAWKALLSDAAKGPAYDISVDKNGSVWFGVWNGIYRFSDNSLIKIKNIDSPISKIHTGNTIQAMGPKGLWFIEKDQATQQEMPYAHSVRSLLPDKNNGLWIATDVGLYHHTPEKLLLFQNEHDLLGAAVTDIAYSQDGDLWIGGLGGITVYHDENRVGHFTPKEGLISIDVNCVERAPDGTMWIGTKQGIARFDGESWSMRYSRRWLINNDVRDIAFDANGNAWIATAKGVSLIKRRTLTLAEKADYFHRILETRHIRAPYIVEKCQLAAPGDTTNWQPRDDDNDGQYTSMYLAMESYRYAVTKNPKAKENAKKAFETLKFLQTVTETPGFVARTVIPSTWDHMHDANRTYTPQEWADILVDNPRDKMVTTRWRPSRDGKWLWKGDTSSDEITGHMYGYLIYYDLIARHDKTEAKRVSDHVCRIMDYIMDGGYTLLDIDGKHTKWAVWAPERLNDDPDWAPERWVNSVEILSYLKLAYHVSGKSKYQQAYLDLIHNHGYLDNARQARTTNPAFITHIDDELLALAYPCLLWHEDNPEFLKVYRQSAYRWHRSNEADNSPYFNFTYAALSGFDPNLEKSVDYLRDISLDLVSWRMDHTIREDLGLVRYPEFETVYIAKMLPASEIALFRWDNNPWQAIRGDGGYTESDGVFYLLPYWMGRYYNLIK